MRIQDKLQKFTFNEMLRPVCCFISIPHPKLNNCIWYLTSERDKYKMLLQFEDHSISDSQNDQLILSRYTQNTYHLCPQSWPSAGVKTIKFWCPKPFSFFPLLAAECNITLEIHSSLSTSKSSAVRLASEYSLMCDSGCESEREWVCVWGRER